MDISGACHCGNLTYRLQWPETRIPARACRCMFCRKHGASWTSHPQAQLQVWVHDANQVERYAFGTGTADFHVCRRCGVPVVATSTIEGGLYAVVNANTFEGVDASLLDHASSDFDGEAVGDRLARRKARWIADVRL